jgi:hypothetical protein
MRMSATITCVAGAGTLSGTSNDCFACCRRPFSPVAVPSERSHSRCVFSLLFPELNGKSCNAPW